MDGKGLGRTTDGVFDTIITGPSMRQLINVGYLTDYRIFAPNSHIDLSDVPIGSDGDYSKPKLKIAVRKSRIVGDVIEHYARIARGKLGVTFATDVETATDIAHKFCASGIPAEMVCAETPDFERIRAIKRFRNREILQLVNVDLFGEGFDLPAIEVVSMARPTQSYNLFVQQFGRGLRVMVDAALYDIWDTFTDAQRRGHIAASSKPRGIIIDHVNNVMTHGLPDVPRKWTLERRTTRKSEINRDAVLLRTCPNPKCNGVYERILPACPYCGLAPKPSSRSSPEFVDGNLLELDEATLAKMRGEVDRIDMPVGDYGQYLMSRGVPHLGVLAGVKRHKEDQHVQETLRATIAWWAGYQRANGRDDAASYKLFYLTFGIDVLSAKALRAVDAQTLDTKIIEDIEKIKINMAQ
jgi:superfamily II DNA or RNA helicase